MRPKILLGLGIALVLAGCDSRNTARSVFGRADVHNLEAICTGKIALSQGSALVRDN